MNYKKQVWSSLIALMAIIFAAGTLKAQDRPEEKLGWKLGAQAYSFNRFTLAEAIAKTDSCKLKYIEAYPGQNIGGGVEGKMDFTMSKEKRAQVLQLLKDKGITLVAFGVVNADSPEGWRQLFEFAKAMGIKNINTEPKQEDLPLIGKLANEFKIKVSIHNHPNPTHYWSPEIVLNAIQLANSKYVGACADIGHWVRSGLDPIECLQKYKGHINHLHFKDLNEKSRDAHDVHWGTGVGNVKGVMQELKNQKFKGMLSAEYEYNWLANSADIAASAENFRKLVKELE
ncbi:sugar phosphate isomerase/epimerase [Olivibacter sp. CPCC 100613]|uniref:sugar phosphate isomerase/epimerase family protein n=1 Tax=Olivibacter sp. CPCC 100613 TaxID=3079931 RepID=UPI002FFC9129